MDESMASFNENDQSYKVTEEGKAKLCKDACRAHVDLIKKAPDSSALIKACPKEDQIATILLHDAFDAARMSCPSDDAGPASGSDNQGEAPKSSMRGTRNEQFIFVHELSAAIGTTSKGSCSTLKTVFGKCDYTNVGKVWISQVDAMLDKLSSSNKEQMLDKLRTVCERENINPEKEPMMFKDWALFRLGFKEAVDCALSYAMRKKSAQISTL
jgi:hypothetical protein